MAAMARDELELQLQSNPQAYAALLAAINAVVDLSIPDPLPSDWEEQHRYPLLSGELKAIAKPFYDHLRSLDSAWLDMQMAQQGLQQIEPGTFPQTFSPYPWSETTSDDSNKAVATIGQLKAVFSLDFTLWGTTPTTDTDGDGVVDEIERLKGTSPSLVDSDHDGVADGLDAYPLDPTLSTFPDSSPGDTEGPVVTLSSPANAVEITAP